MKNRILVMSNIHGYLDEMLALLREADYSPEKDKLILLGDYVDYGPRSIDVVNTIMNLRNYGATVLRGCREQMYITAFTSKDEEKRNQYEEKLYNTNNNLIDFYLDKPDIKDKHIAFFKSLQPVTKIDNYIFSHAGYNIGKENDTFFYSIWDRNFYKRTEETQNTNNIYVFGHIPVIFMEGHEKSEVFSQANMIGVDFGAVSKKGGLALVEIAPERTVYSIKLSTSFKTA